MLPSSTFPFFNSKTQAQADRWQLILKAASQNFSSLKNPDSSQQNSKSGFSQIILLNWTDELSLV